MLKNELVVFKNGKMTITSLELVGQINFFRQEEGKAELAHYDLLKIIRDEFDGEIGQGEISVSSYSNSQNKKQPMYNLTTLQAKQLLARESKHVRKALLVYIERLEGFIREKTSAEWQEARKLGKLARKGETDVILSKLIPHAESQGSKNAGKLYMAYSKLVNSVLGIEAGQRGKLPQAYVDAVRFMEHAIENIISLEVDKGTPYKEIYQICKAKCGIVRELSFLPSASLLEGKAKTPA